jgi:hypothetical protein
MKWLCTCLLLLWCCFGERLDGASAPTLNGWLRGRYVEPLPWRPVKYSEIFRRAGIEDPSYSLQYDEGAVREAVAYELDQVLKPSKPATGVRHVLSAVIVQRLAFVIRVLLKRFSVIEQGDFAYRVIFEHLRTYAFTPDAIAALLHELRKPLLIDIPGLHILCEELQRMQAYERVREGILHIIGDRFARISPDQSADEKEAILRRMSRGMLPLSADVQKNIANFLESMHHHYNPDIIAAATRTTLERIGVGPIVTYALARSGTNEKKYS